MDYLRKEIVRSLRNELRDMLRDALCKALSPTAHTTQNFSPTPTPTPTPQLAVPPTGRSITKPSTFSRAPTLEAPSSPLLSPTSSALRLPYKDLPTATKGGGGGPCSSNKDSKDTQHVIKYPSTNPFITEPAEKICSNATNSPVLLRPITESENNRLFKQMYTQI